MICRTWGEKSVTKNCHPDNLFAWISVATLLLLLLFPIANKGMTFDVPSVCLFFNGLFGIVMLWLSMADAPYSLRQVHWIFYITFFSVSPLIQYMSNTWPWGYSPTNTKTLTVCGFVFLWGVVFAISSGRSRSAAQVNDERNRDYLTRKVVFTLTPAARIVLPVLSVCCFAVILSIVGVENIFLRSTNKIGVGSTSLDLIINICLRAFIFGSFALLLLNARQASRYYGGVFISGLCFLITCFPTALARFNVAAIYLGFAILLFPVLSRKRGLFAFVLILGFLIAYPLFNAFKYIGNADSFGDAIEIVISSMTAGYTSGNYDAFSVMFWCLDFVSRFGITMGMQLVGSLLFFIPRTIWPNKPIPSGELVFSTLKYPFTDISFSVPFEGYLNFGLFGLLLFAFIYGLIVRKLDGVYWSRRMSKNADKLTVLSIYYPFLLCLTFYMLRGAMMTTFTYVFGDLVAMVVLYFAASL